MDIQTGRPRGGPIKTLRTWLRQGAATARICAAQKLAAGPLVAMSTHFVKLGQFVVFVLLWRGFAGAGADLGGMTETQLLTYTLISFVLRQQLNIVTPATASLWEGSVVGRYTRAMPPYLSFISETVGRAWIPFALFFGLPVLLISPLLGISPLPAAAVRGGLFVLSLLLAVTIGFAFDLFFAAIAIRLKEAMWIATRIREAIYNLLSGALVPFALFPGWAQTVLSLLPFGSVASAPLSIYVGMGRPGPLLAIQLFWAVVLWPLAHWAYKKSEERMVSYGG